MNKPARRAALPDCFRQGGIAVAALLILIMTAAEASAAYTASTVQDLSNFYDSTIGSAQIGNATLNGQTVDWFPNPDGSKIIYLSGVPLGNKSSWAANDKNGVVQALANALGIAPEEIYINNKDSQGAAQATATTVFSDLILPRPITAAEAAKAEERKRTGMPRTVEAAVRYSYIDTPADNGYLAGLNLGLAWDMDHITMGFIVPYDYTDIDNLLSSQRLGLVLFGQYGTDISDGLSSRQTVYIDYSDTDIDYEAGGSNHLRTHGGGVGTSLTLKAAGITSTIGASIQEHRDNSPGDRTFDTFKLGLSSALPIGRTQVVGITAVWTSDFSDYDAAYEDKNLYEAGITYRNDLSDTWSLSLGLNHKFDYNDVSATEVYLGSAMMF